MTKSTSALLLLITMAGCYDISSLTRGGEDLASVADLSSADLRGSVDLATAPPDLTGGCVTGDVCQQAADPCHTDSICKSDGTCTASKARPDGYGYDSSDPLKRCCDGKPVSVNTAENCGACGTSCGSQPCLYTHGPHYYCACSLNNQCWSQCCSTAYGMPNVCAAGNCATNQPIACPGNAISDNDDDGPFYCHY